MTWKSVNLTGKASSEGRLDTTNFTFLEFALNLHNYYVYKKQQILHFKNQMIDEILYTSREWNDILAKFNSSKSM